MSAVLTLRPFVEGDNVKYVPCHAHGDQSHPDCEIGQVTRIASDGTVFVMFTHPHVRHWPQGCNSADLVHTP